MPALTRHTKIDYGDGPLPLALTWFVRGPAGAVALNVQIAPQERPGWVERTVFAGRHAYVRLSSEDARRDGECDVLEGTDTCWFNARDSWGQKLWARATAPTNPGGAELIWRELEGYYREEFHP